MKVDINYYTLILEVDINSRAIKSCNRNDFDALHLPKMFPYVYPEHRNRFSSDNYSIEDVTNYLGDNGWKLSAVVPSSYPSGVSYDFWFQKMFANVDIPNVS